MTSIRSFIKKHIQKKNVITIVSGLPRSGTSLMMSALKAGGMPLLVDGVRQSDDNNPKGYFEYERVKKLAKGDSEWLFKAQGKAVKIISALLEYLPDEYHYQVIFMERDIEEILASQKRMLERNDKKAESPVADEAMKQYYQAHLSEIKAWLQKKDWIRCMFVSYNDILFDPEKVFSQVTHFSDHDLDSGAMAEVVEPSLYREQQR